MTSRESRFLLIFDLDGTLLDFEKSECISLRKALAKYDRHLDDTQVAEYRRINAEEWRRFESGSQSIDETTIRRFQRFLAEEGFEELSHLAAEINTEFLTALSELALYEPYAYETLEQLRQRGYRLGLLTNGVRWVQERRLARSGLNPFFTHIVTSEEVGVGKPHPAMFLSILERFRAKPEDTLYIGDSYESDILGARAVGMATLWYRKGSTDDLQTGGVPERVEDDFSDWRTFLGLLEDREHRR